MLAGVIDVVNRDELERRFGGWPSFHDAEVHSVRMDSGQQRESGRPSVELDIHVLGPGAAGTAGPEETAAHTLVTFRFEAAEAISLEEFGPQNVLWDLELTEVRENSSGSARGLLSLPSSNGLTGSLRFERALVLAVTDFEPGAGSVYGP